MEALYNRATSSRHQKNYDQALADANAFLKERPTNANILPTRARVFIALAKYQAAIEDCTKGIDEGTQLSNDGTESGRSDYYKLDFLEERAKCQKLLADESTHSVEKHLSSH